MSKVTMRVPLVAIWSIAIEISVPVPAPAPAPFDGAWMSCETYRGAAI
jgi:hypothetical protein